MELENSFLGYKDNTLNAVRTFTEADVTDDQDRCSSGSS